jgi:L-rhamnose mutarotase
MELVVTRTRLRPGRELDYEAAHRILPEDVRADLVRRGIVDWRIFRDGLDLIHVITAEPSFAAFEATVPNPEIGERWLAQMGEYLDMSDDGRTAGPLKPIWRLADEL